MNDMIVLIGTSYLYIYTILLVKLGRLWLE